jgi:hypothetical protein
MNHPASLHPAALDTLPKRLLDAGFDAGFDDALDHAESLDALAESATDASIDTPDRFGPCEDSYEFKAQWVERWSPLFPGK